MTKLISMTIKLNVPLEQLEENTQPNGKQGEWPRKHSSSLLGAEDWDAGSVCRYAAGILCLQPTIVRTSQIYLPGAQSI